MNTFQMISVSFQQATTLHCAIYIYFYTQGLLINFYTPIIVVIPSGPPQNV